MWTIIKSQTGKFSGKGIPAQTINHIHTNFNSIFSSPVSVNEIKDITLTIKSKTSQGLDGITIIRHFVASSQFHCVNQSFESGVFYDEMKSELVVSLFRKGDKNEAKNYTPISILNGFSFEKAYRKQVTVIP